jgi:hypothetical protein
MIVYATLLYLLHPDGQTRVPIDTLPTAMECSDVMPTYYSEVKDGWSIHCYAPTPLIRPKARPSRTKDMS